MSPESIIVAGIIAAVIGKFFKSKKGPEHVKVDVHLPYTKKDLFFDLSFSLLAILSWGFALWIFLKAGFSFKQLLICLLLTLAGLAMLLLHLFPREASIPKGKEDLAVDIRCAEATANRWTSLLCLPLMAAYMVSENTSLFGIEWDFEYVFLGILILMLVVNVSLEAIFLKKHRIDIALSDLDL